MYIVNELTNISAVSLLPRVFTATLKTVSSSFVQCTTVLISAPAAVVTTTLWGSCHVRRVCVAGLVGFGFTLFLFVFIIILNSVRATLHL